MDLAKQLGGTIINCDSKQIYKDLRIITARPTKQDEATVPHKLYGCIDGSINFTTADWIKLAVKEIKQAKQPILVGGTGLYITSLIEGLSPIPPIDSSIRHKLEAMDINELNNELKIVDNAAYITAANNPVRIIRAMEVYKGTGKTMSHWQSQPRNKFFELDNFKLLELLPDRQQNYKNAEQRWDVMLQMGIIDEVKTLMAKNYPSHLPIMRAHGVPELIKYINGDISLEEASIKAKQNTRNYIKRQHTWFKNQFRYKKERV